MLASPLGWDFSCLLHFVEHWGLVPGWGGLSLRWPKLPQRVSFEILLQPLV